MNREREREKEPKSPREISNEFHICGQIKKTAKRPARCFAKTELSLFFTFSH